MQIGRGLFENHALLRRALRRPAIGLIAQSIVCLLLLAAWLGSICSRKRIFWNICG
jgi:hypothetical protein